MGRDEAVRVNYRYGKCQFVPVMLCRMDMEQTLRLPKLVAKCCDGARGMMDSPGNFRELGKCTCFFLLSYEMLFVLFEIV